MKIKNIIYAAGTAGFYFDDQRAIKAGARHDGFVYDGNPVTPGFTAVRQAGECISIIIVLANGHCGIGDAVAVQYSGAGGRDPLFLAENYIPFLEKHVTPVLFSLNVGNFRESAAYIDQLRIDGKRLHTALRYGLSQALLDAKANSEGRLPCEVLCDEYLLPVIPERIPVFGQCGDDRYDGVDKMILKRVDVLPHGLINNVDDKLGRHGEKLLEYVGWLRQRIIRLRHDDVYNPVLHIDVYGTPGLIFGNHHKRVADYLARLGNESGEFQLYIEGPVDMEGKEPQMEALGLIKAALNKSGSPVRIVADEWCNSYEDIVDFTSAGCCHMAQLKTPDLGGIHNLARGILHCKANGMEAYQGGSCNESDVSARMCVQVALAARPERILAKPGMGFDEGYTITNNEMSRTLAILRAEKGGSKA